MATLGTTAAKAGRHAVTSAARNLIPERIPGHSARVQIRTPSAIFSVNSSSTAAAAYYAAASGSFEERRCLGRACWGGEFSAGRIGARRVRGGGFGGCTRRVRLNGRDPAHAILK